MKTRLPGTRAVWLAAMLACAGTMSCTSACARLRLASLEPYPAGARIAGPSGGYELTTPTDAWARNPRNEGSGHIDLALARKSGDAWLDVSVVTDRYATADLALAPARARANSLMLADERDERDVIVPAPEGGIAGRQGVYCGSFDREMRARDNCFVILTVVRDRTAWVLVGQAHVRGDDDLRRPELEQLMDSLRILPAAPPQAKGGG